MLLMLLYLNMCLAIVRDSFLKHKCDKDVKIAVFIYSTFHATPDVYIHQFFSVEGKFLCLIFRRMLDIVSPDVFLRALAGFGTHTKSVLYILYSFPSCKLNYHDSPGLMKATHWREEGAGLAARFMSGYKKSSPLFEIIILTT